MMRGMPRERGGTVSVRAAGLRRVIKRHLYDAWRPDIWKERGSHARAGEVARAICEHLGLSWDSFERDPNDNGWCVYCGGDLVNLNDPMPHDDGCLWVAIATLLEAAGIEDARTPHDSETEASKED